MIDVNPTHLETITRILAAHVPGREVRAFGSRATWTAKDYSDLDLAVVCARALDRDVLRHLREAFEESDLPFRVDVLDWHAVGSAFRKVIDKQYEVVQKGERVSVGTASEAAIENHARWPVVSLAEVAIKIGSGATPRGGGDTYLPHRTRFALVRSQNVFDRRFDHDGLAFITDEQAEELRGVALQPDDVLLNITGDGITFGRACMVPKDILPACVNQHVAIIRVDSERADAGYVLAFLTHPDVKSYIESFNAGGSRRAITKGHIESFRLPLPPLREQHAIAHILGTLDDKIELSQRMNKTLEAMARALFESWLADVVSVRVRVSNLIHDGILEIGDGYRAKNSELGDSGLPFIRAGNLKNGFDTTGAEILRAESVAKAGSKVCRVGDVAFTSKGTIGRFARVTEDTPQFVYSPQVCYWRSLDPARLHPVMLYCWMKSDDLGAQIAAVAGQTDMAPYVSLQDQRQMLVPVFPASQHAVASRIEALLARQSSNVAETRTLVAMRDALLPKLISGELRVPDAERFV